MNPNYILTPGSPQEDMGKIAYDLMNNWVLSANESHFRLTEIEFYYRQGTEHNDMFIHGNKLQDEYGRWYFHGSGLDITIGRSAYSASILIRAIFNIKSAEYIYGPLNVVSALFNSFGIVNLHEIPIGLVKVAEDTLKVENPIAARRVGLNKDKDPETWAALYRFLIMPKEKHADKTGIAEVMESSGRTASEIKSIWG
jgi:hypothetical protein